jgi:serine/threonine-protein kinase RsbW
MKSPFARLTLPARVQSVRAFHEFVRGGAVTAGLGPTDMDKLDLVLEEILVNIARYAYAGGTGDMEVAYAADGGTLIVEITDHGSSFNPLEAAPPDLTLGLAERPVGGLGVLLVKEIVGSLCYRREMDQNTVSFRFPGSQAART